MTLGLETSVKLIGRRGTSVEFENVGELTADDMKLLVGERGVQKPKGLAAGRQSSLARLSERHRSLARLIALGKKDWEVSAITGYTVSRISILKNDPAMKNLIAHYSEEIDIAYQGVYEKSATVASTALDAIQDRLEDEEAVAELTTGQLLEIYKSTADRSGTGPSTKTTTEVNVNIADRLQAARERALKARVIEATAVEVKDE